jgi:hypothetical protein
MPYLSMKSMWRSVNLLDRCRRQSQVSPGFALIRFEKIASMMSPSGWASRFKGSGT